MTDSFFTAEAMPDRIAINRLRIPLLLSLLVHCLLLPGISASLTSRNQASLPTAALTVQLVAPIRDTPLQRAAPSSQRHSAPAHPAATSARGSHRRSAMMPARNAPATPATTLAAPPPGVPASQPPSDAPLPDQAPRYRQLNAPAYPLWSRSHQEQGVVWLRVLVDTEGQVRQVTLVLSSGFSRLDQAADQAVRHWQFTPGTHQGRPITAEVQIPVSFSLRQP